MYFPAFSGVSPLCHQSEPDVLHDPPPLRTVPRPIGEGLSIAFGALRLSEKLFLRKLTLSNFKLSFELKKNTENDRNIEELAAKLRFGT
jgi:hypothetical protein